MDNSKAAEPPLQRPDQDEPSGAARGDAQPVGRVGNALRTVYQRTVEESVPDEMIDLLSRL